MSLIIDVSSNNGPTDWRTAKLHGVDGVFIKATEGRSYTSSVFPLQAKGARSAGLRVGFYHFARPDQNTAQAEAQHFCNVIGPIGTHDFKPVLDYEQANRLTSSEQREWIREFNSYVRERLGIIPIFYSYPAFIVNLRLSPPVGNGLWLASYGPDDGHRHEVTAPSPWKKVHLHQYTSKGKVEGCVFPVDLSFAPRLTPLLAHPVKSRLLRPLL